MHAVQQLIQKFWSGETSEEENQLLIQLLIEQETALSEADKAAFFKRKEDGTIVVEATRSQHMLERMHAQMKDKELTTATDTAKVVPLKRNRTWWVAASVVVLLGSVAYLFAPLFSKQDSIVAGKESRAHEGVKTVTNHTDSIMEVALQDGSVVSISGHSAISFYEPFSAEARNISLAGEAVFKVAKDAKRPFTVYANGIATTALGTVFTVNTLVRDIVSVQLFEGKVVIRSADGSRSMKDVYLDPGQEFTINKNTNSYIVKAGSAANSVASGPAGSRKEENGRKPDIILVFNNEPLARVFHKLEERYRIKIQFNENDVAGRYFSGNVLKDDSLKIVLSAICNSNQLSFSREQDHIQIQIQQ
ncbi:MAG: FecR domain-containing protein [Chitinophagaceae bacterium]